MPARGDRLPTQAVAGVSKEAAQRNNREPQTDMLRAIAALSALSRGERDDSLALEIKRDAERRAEQVPDTPARRAAAAAAARGGDASTSARADPTSSVDEAADYVNGGLLGWWRSRSAARARAREEARLQRELAAAAENGVALHESPPEPPAAAPEAAAEANGSQAWRVLSDVRKATESRLEEWGARRASDAVVLTSQAVLDPPEAPAVAPPVEPATAEVADAALTPVSWPMLKRVGLASVRPPSSFAVISVELEERMVGVAATGDPGLLRLFEAFAMNDVFRFIQVWPPVWVEGVVGERVGLANQRLTEAALLSTASLEPSPAARSMRAATCSPSPDRSADLRCRHDAV